MSPSKSQVQPLLQLQRKLKTCQECKNMFGPPVVGMPNLSPVMLIGQAPGNKEIELHRPFAWTAGKTLFKWFAQTGLEEETFRKKIYMSAVCRCFPGKNPKGGDRVPTKTEIETCQQWINRELALVQPQLIIPIGKLAIGRFIKINKLTDIVGSVHSIELNQQNIDLIALPHPSGASTWHHTEPGKTLLLKALKMIQSHPAWKKIK